ncbi:MAG: hypothetical protein ABW321_13855 [Polyangiales bacterium]
MSPSILLALVRRVLSTGRAELRDFAADTRGNLMPEYVLVTAAGVAIAAAVFAMVVVLSDHNERALQLINLEIP